MSSDSSNHKMNESPHSESQAFMSATGFKPSPALVGIMKNDQPLFGGLQKPAQPVKRNPLHDVFFPSPSPIVGYQLSALPHFISTQHPHQDGSGSVSINVCQVCLGIFERRSLQSITSPGYKVERSITSLYYSSKSGCPLCRAILQRFRPVMAAQLQEPYLTTSTDAETFVLHSQVLGLRKNSRLVLHEEGNEGAVLEYRMVRQGTNLAIGKSLQHTGWSH